MNNFKVYYHLESKKEYKHYENAIELNEPKELLSFLLKIKPEDTLYIFVDDTKHRLIINCETEENVFFEIDTPESVVFDQTISISKAKEILLQISECLSNPENFGFKVSPY